MSAVLGSEVRRWIDKETRPLRPSPSGDDADAAP
jgi:hypothetical protein